VLVPRIKACRHSSPPRLSHLLWLSPLIPPKLPPRKPADDAPQAPADVPQRFASRSKISTASSKKSPLSLLKLLSSVTTARRRSTSCGKKWHNLRQERDNNAGKYDYNTEQVELHYSALLQTNGGLTAEQLRQECYHLREKCARKQQKIDQLRGVGGLLPSSAACRRPRFVPNK
jgi:hypothetical protein